MNEKITTREKQILELKGQGLSASKIGLALGMTKNAVTGVLTRMRNRIKPEPPEPPDHSIMALTALTCRYPFGDVYKGGVTYCCAMVENPGVDVYCREHADLCHQPLAAYQRANARAMRRAGVID